MNCEDSHISQEKMSNALSYLSLTGWSCRQFGSVILADKAIDKRIRNRLLKEYGIKAEVTYELKPSANLYPAGELIITYRPDPLDFKLMMEEDHKYTSL